MKKVMNSIVTVVSMASSLAFAGTGQIGSGSVSYDILKGDYALLSQSKSGCSVKLKIDDSERSMSCNGLQVTMTSENGYWRSENICNINSGAKHTEQPANPYEMGIIGELMGYTGVLKTKTTMETQFSPEAQSLLISFQRDTARFATKSITTYKLEGEKLSLNYLSDGYLGQDSLNCEYEKK